MRAAPLLLGLLLPASLGAQDMTTPKGPITQVAWMIGEWEGPATYSRGGAGGALRQTERIELVSGGTAIAVRGRGFERTADGSEKVVFEAFATLFKNRDGTLGFRAFSMEGHYIDPVIEMRNDGMIWSFEDGRGTKIRYTITHTPSDQWHEVGEWSRDGASWTQFMEMTLNRTTAASHP